MHWVADPAVKRRLWDFAIKQKTIVAARIHWSSFHLCNTTLEGFLTKGD